MRKAALFVGGGLSFALLCTVVWAKEEPGSRQTFGQRVNSLFGMVDTGSNAPPPAPPDMPQYGRSRPQHGGNAQRSIAHQPEPGAAAARMGAAQPMSPPAPQRVDNPADQSSAAGPSTATRSGVASGTGLVQQSRQGSAFASRTTTAAQASQRSTTTAAAPAGGYRSNVATSQAASPQAAPTTTTAAVAVPRSTGSAPSLPPAVINSRRRQPTGNAGDALPAVAPAPTTTAAPQSSASAAAPSTTAPTMTATPAPSGEAYTPPPIFVADARANPVNTVPVNTAPVNTTPSAEPIATPIPSARRTASVDTTPLAVAPAPLAAQPQSVPLTASASVPGATAAAPAYQAPSAIASPIATQTAGRQAAVLAAFNSPEITVETIGPQRISIGREAAYRIVVRNRGNTEAQQVTVTLGVPQWAEIAELHGTSGSTTSAEEHASGKPLEWRIESLSGRDEEELTLVIIPRRSESFDLGVRWACSPAAAAAAIDVEEPQLKLSISGPSEVSYGEQRLYKLTVANPGTGTAEDVHLHLQPLSAGDGEAVTHKIGDLPAGQDLSVEVELTARQAGRLQIRTEATAAGDLKASAATDVVVHRAALDVLVSAPKLLFAGVPGNYEVRVRNTGDDHARNVRVAVDMPSGAKLLSASPAPRNDAGSREVVWSLDRLPAGSEQVYNLKVALGAGGTQSLTASAAADGDLRKSASASTNVQAVADLVLDVLDTPGPIAVGEPVTFEIHVKNRGMKSAEGVDVVAFFSDGIEPEKAEGHTFELQPGMCVFKTLTTLGANQERVFKITARASTGGNHRLRVELHSANPQTDLSQEDSTFFYSDENETVSSSGSTNSQPIVAGFNTSGNTNVAVNAGAATSPTALPIITAGGSAGATMGAPNNVGDRYATEPTNVGNAVPSVVPYGAGNPANTSNVPGTFTPAAAQPIAPGQPGAANAPATVYPAALPRNGLR